MLAEGFGEIAEKLRRSTVFVSCGRRGQGSGMIVKPHGVIVTNAHVAASEPIQVQMWDGTTEQAELTKRDAARDIAILRIARSSLPAATLANSDRARVGELVVAVGNPMGFIGALTTGVVHAIGRVPALGARKWIQSDVRLAPGNSGGPLADAQGRVVGMNTMVAAGMGLAIPSNAILRCLHGTGARSPLGVVARPVEIAHNGSQRLGLLLLEIAKDSAAERASLMLGDVLVGAGGTAIDSMDDFEQALEAAGDRIRLQFLRGDQRNVRTVTVRLELPNEVAA
jgi:serine protease Do